MQMVKTGLSIAELETDRLHLRAFSMDDLESLARIFANSTVVKHMGDGKPASRDETNFALETIVDHYTRHGYGRLAVINKENNALIGYGGLRNFSGIPELVYLLDEPYWNQGFATEIGHECLKYGFNEQGFDQIVAMTKPENLASKKVLGKLGMQPSGLIEFHGYEVCFYSISVREYRSKTRETQ
jgi:ribosomal-protein-alanine N-acetyltransferase